MRNGNQTATKTFGEHLGSGSLYRDNSFPASKSSLFWSHNLPDKAGKIQELYEGRIESWKRPADIMNLKNQEGNNTLPSLWGDEGIKPTEAVTQGRLADNWFLGAAAALAEHPERVKSLFSTTNYAHEGIFESYFYVKGYKTAVVFDDRLAVLTNGKPVNSRQSESSAWWLVLLEKGYAKLNVNYLNLRGGYLQEAFRALTGMPVLTFHSD